MPLHSHSRKTSMTSYKVAMCWPLQVDPYSWLDCQLSSSCFTCWEIYDTSIVFLSRSLRIGKCKATYFLDRFQQYCLDDYQVLHAYPSQLHSLEIEALMMSSWKDQQTVCLRSGSGLHSCFLKSFPPWWYGWWKLLISSQNWPLAALHCPLFPWMSF